jgi:glycogen operon protein
VLDTSAMGEVEPSEVKPGDTVTVEGRSIGGFRGPAL